MATSKRGSVTMHVDERSIRSFTHNVDALVRATESTLQQEAVSFCEDVLADANSLIPVDTATAAESASYEIEMSSYGPRVRMGYGISKNPINPRSGQSAKSYVAELHEDLTVEHTNGQAKFFEQALYEHTSDFERRNGKAMSELLSGANTPTAPLATEPHEDIYAPAYARLGSGFTAQHAGRYLPYPGAAKAGM